METINSEYVVKLYKAQKYETKKVKIINMKFNNGSLNKIISGFISIYIQNKKIKFVFQAHIFPLTIVMSTKPPFTI